MKRIYLAKRNALLRGAHLSWGSGALMLAIAAFLVRLVLPDVFWRLAMPVFTLSAVASDTSHVFFASFNNAAALTLENDQLTKDNAALASENAALQTQVAELSRLAAGDADAIVAHVVARPPTSPYDTLVVAKGARAGVTRGMEAFGAGDVPLGIVQTVSDNFSSILLFSAPGIRTDGWVGRERLPVTLIGVGGGAFSATMSRAANVVAGDTVFAPGPGQLTLGSVARVDSDASSPSVTLRIAPATNLFSTSVVELRDTGFGALATSTPL